MKKLILFSLFAAFVLAMACAKAPMAEVKKMEKDADVPRISVADAKKEVEAGTAVIVDSRPETNFTAEHIAGSINIPFGSNNDAFTKLPPDKKIIVYCS